MPVSSLYGDYSIGNFGKSAFEFIDFIADCGFSVWQVLPFTVTDEYNSPYKSFSAFGGNPYFVDPEKLFEDGLISEDNLENSKQKTPFVAEYERLGKLFAVKKDFCSMKKSVPVCKIRKTFA